MPKPGPAATPAAPKPSAPAAKPAAATEPKAPAAATAPTEAPAKPKAAKPTGAKPAGFTKPAGFGKKASIQDLDEEEEKATHPSIMVCAWAAVLAMLVVLYFQYNIDQNIARQSEPLLGWPSTGEVVESGDEAEEPAEEESSEEEE